MATRLEIQNNISRFSVAPQEQKQEAGGQFKDLTESEVRALKLMAESHRGKVPSETNTYSVITQRDVHILELLAKGKTFKEIGNSLGLAEKTIKNLFSDRSGIYKKLGILNHHGVPTDNDQTGQPQHYREAVKRALGLGLIKPDDVLALREKQKTRVLSPNEIETLRLVAEHKSNEEIAGLLSISRRSVNGRRISLFQKLNVKDQKSAVKKGKKYLK